MEINQELYDRTYKWISEMIENRSVNDLPLFKNLIETNLYNDVNFRSIASATYSYRHKIQMDQLLKKVMSEEESYCFELEFLEVYCSVMSDYVNNLSRI